MGLANARLTFTDHQQGAEDAQRLHDQYGNGDGDSNERDENTTGDYQGEQ
jgi:hypothetical protein